MLADHAIETGNFRTAAVNFMTRVTLTSGHKSYSIDEYALHYLHEEESALWFACIAERALGREVPINFLEALRDACAPLSAQAEMGEALSLQRQLEPEIADLLARCNTPGDDRVPRMMEKVQQIHNVLGEAVEKIMERQDKIELLVHTSHTLAESSESFQNHARELHRVVWWRNARVMTCLCIVGVLVVVIFFWMACGLQMQCLRH